MQSVRSIVILMLCWAAAPNVFAVDSVRCGNKIIRVGDFSTRVLRICGDPAYRELLALEEIEHTYKSEHYKISKTKVVRVEQWTYDQGRGYFLKLLTFRSGRLSRIENGDRM